MQDARVRFRAFPKGTRYICGKTCLLAVVISSLSHFSLDLCFSSLLFRCWFCPRCGFELCGLCHEARPTLNSDPTTPCAANHCRSWLRPVAVFTAEALQDHIGAMEAVLASPPPKGLDVLTNGRPIIPEAIRHTELYTQEMPRYSVEELTGDLFHEKWVSGEPFVLTGIIGWAAPEELLDLKKTGRKRCTTAFYDGETWQRTTSTLGSYFNTWKKDQLPGRSLQIRVCPSALSHYCVHANAGLPAEWRS